MQIPNHRSQSKHEPRIPLVSNVRYAFPVQLLGDTRTAGRCPRVAVCCVRWRVLSGLCPWIRSCSVMSMFSVSTAIRAVGSWSWRERLPSLLERLSRAWQRPPRRTCSQATASTASMLSNAGSQCNSLNSDGRRLLNSGAPGTHLPLWPRLVVIAVVLGESAPAYRPCDRRGGEIWLRR